MSDHRGTPSNTASTGVSQASIGRHSRPKTLAWIEWQIAVTLTAALLAWAAGNHDVTLPMPAYIALILWALASTGTTAVLFVQKRRTGR